MSARPLLRKLCGLALLGLGAVMLVTPGPGLLLLLAGWHQLGFGSR